MFGGWRQSPSDMKTIHPQNVSLNRCKLRSRRVNSTKRNKLILVLLRKDPHKVI
uniref:Uncharacterized protein n=1 Tax=Rhizophora mucronata TaxID=61149 RepID=A0A2P2N8M4_RHIMU